MNRPTDALNFTQMTTSDALPADLPSPPLADGLPLVGSVLPMMSDMEGFVYRQYLKHGPCFRVKVPGRDMVVLGGQKRPRLWRATAARSTPGRSGKTLSASSGAASC